MSKQLTIVTGCERSGTTGMLNQQNALILNEPKWIVGLWKCYSELVQYKRYPESEVLLKIRNMANEIHPFPKEEPMAMKHSLNLFQNIGLLQFLKKLYPNAHFIYMIRDGRNVALSVANKTWGTNLVSGTYERTLYEGGKQWSTVVKNTWQWALSFAEIIRYEDTFDRKSDYTTLEVRERSELETEIYQELVLTKYIRGESN